MLEADYKQLEVVVLAALSQDAQMRADLEKNIDFHSKRVCMLHPELNYMEVVQGRQAPGTKGEKFRELRQKAKVFSFQRQYGAGVAKLAASTGLKEEEIRVLIAREEETYPGVVNFHLQVNREVHHWRPSLQDGSRSGGGHRAYKGEFHLPTGTRFTFGEVERAPKPGMEGGG